VYATFSGPLPTDARLWGAILRAGPGAVAGPWSSLWLIGVLDRPPDVLDVLVPAERRVRGAGQLRVRRRRGLGALMHPASSPPRLRVEAAVLQAAATVRQDAEAIDLVLRAVQRRPTTAERLAEQLGPDDERFRDRARDNVVTVSGRRTLRYGWREVTDDPCGVAAEVAAVLQDLGWTGSPRRCGPGCSIA
jgi:hypothetical protein